MTQPARHKLDSLSPRAFQHPADRAATAALDRIPGLDTAVRKLTEFQYERALRQSLPANSVKVGPRQLPEIWEVYEHALRTLDLPAQYDLYVTQWPVANAAAFGYIRRGDADIRGDTDAAVGQYLDRFWTILKDASRGAESARARVSDWMQRRESDDG